MSGQMGIVKDRARCSGELLSAVSIAADVEPLAPILFVGLASLGAALLRIGQRAIIFLDLRYPRM